MSINNPNPGRPAVSRPNLSQPRPSRSNQLCLGLHPALSQRAGTRGPVALRSAITTEQQALPQRFLTLCFLVIGLLLLSNALPLRAQVLSGQVDYPALGVSFQIPPGWAGQETEAGIVLGHQSEAGLMLVMQHPYTTIDDIKRAADEGIVDASLSLQRDGDFQQQSDTTLGAPFSGSYEGQPARAWAVAVLNPHGAGVSVLAMTTADAWTESLAERARSLAGSLVFSKPDNGAEIAEWKDYLRDVRLTYMDSDYSSGPSVGGYMTGGGHSTEKLLHLCAAGFFHSSSSSSMSFDTGGGFGSTASSDQGAGQWDVVAGAQGQTLLRLNTHEGDVYEFALGYEDGKTYLDGTRYFVTGRDDPNGYAPDCP